MLERPPGREAASDRRRHQRAERKNHQGRSRGQRSDPDAQGHDRVSAETDAGLPEGDRAGEQGGDLPALGRSAGGSAGCHVARDRREQDDDDPRRLVLRLPPQHRKPGCLRYRRDEGP